MQAALDGAGLALVAHHRAAPHLARGELRRVMEEWPPRFPASSSTYPHRKQLPAALTAVMDTLRLSM
jgi:DNA-binding transcriptional LysR family regulator